MTQISLAVPTCNDELHDFDCLFGLWNTVNASYYDQLHEEHMYEQLLGPEYAQAAGGLEVTFEFSHCRFLRQNAVAFLGGLARLIPYRGGRVTFAWNTLQDNIWMNLAQQGFPAAFGHTGRPWTGNSIPFREDCRPNPRDQMDYLKSKWIGRGWVSVSQALRNAIVGRMWEIYANAFEHSESPIGVFSCGQHFPRQRELNLTVVDFGVGIPSNVRIFARKPTLTAAKALRWAFQPGTTTRPNGVGRGMGLDLLKQFIRLNHG